MTDLNSEWKREKNKIPLLASGVPNLGLDDLIIDTNAAGGEFDADGRLRFEAELVASEAGEEIGFADSGVADENNLEEVIVIVVGSVRGHWMEMKMKVAREMWFLQGSDPNLLRFRLV